MSVHESRQYKHPPPEAELGVRLRTLREQRGLSQRELARRAGVTNASISQIEQGRVSPSVASLRKIVEPLGLSLAAFFAGEVARASPFILAADLPEVGTGGVSQRRVGGGPLQVLVERYPPGADTGVRVREAAGEVAGVVLIGQIEVTVGEWIQILGTGDAFAFSRQLPHRFHNVGADPCELVSAESPAPV